MHILVSLPCLIQGWMAIYLDFVQTVTFLKVKWLIITDPSYNACLLICMISLTTSSTCTWSAYNHVLWITMTIIQCVFLLLLKSDLTQKIDLSGCCKTQFGARKCEHFAEKNCSCTNCADPKHNQAIQLHTTKLRNKLDVNHTFHNISKCLLFSDLKTYT